jgi:hypothetical protein
VRIPEGLVNGTVKFMALVHKGLVTMAQRMVETRLTVVYATTGHVKSVASLQKVDMRIPYCFALAAPEIMSPSCAYRPPIRAPIEVPSTHADIDIKNLLVNFKAYHQCDLLESHSLPWHE